MRTDWKDSIYTKRKLELQPNGDGTVTPVDRTDYTQNGDAFGAKELNEIGNEVNALTQEVTETKKSVSDGKALIAAAITLKKVTTAATDTFAKMADNIKLIKTGAGNAASGDVRAGKTFSSDNGEELTGTLAVNGKEYWNQNLNVGVESTNLYSFGPAGIYEQFDNRGTLHRIPIARVREVIGLAANKLWPGATMLGITSSNSSMSGGTYTPSRSQQTVNCSGRAMTSNVVIAAIPSNYYNIDENQTVFNNGSFAAVSRLGAYYVNRDTGMNPWYAIETAPVTITETGGIGVSGLTSRSAFIFRGAIPSVYKYVKITGAGGSTNNQIRVNVIDPATRRTIRQLYYNQGGTDYFEAKFDFSAVSLPSSGYWLAFDITYSMRENGIRQIFVSKTAF